MEANTPFSSTFTMISNRNLFESKLIQTFYKRSYLPVKADQMEQKHKNPAPFWYQGFIASITMIVQLSLIVKKKHS